MLHCGKSGHVSKQCRSKTDKSHDPQNKKGGNHKIAAIQPEPPIEVTVKVNGVTLDAKADDGAAVTVMDAETARQLKIKASTSVVPKSATAGGEIKVAGAAKVSITVKIGRHGRTCDHTIVIAEDIPWSLLLGMDMLKKMRLLADYEDKKLIFKKESHYTNHSMHHRH